MKTLPFAGGVALALASLLFITVGLSSNINPAYAQETECAYTIEEVAGQLPMQGIEFAIVEAGSDLDALVLIALTQGAVLDGKPTRAIVANIQGYMVVGFEVNGCLEDPVNLGPMEQRGSVDPSMFGPLYSPFFEHHA